MQSTRFLWKLLFWLNWAIIAYFWFQGSGSAFLAGGHHRLLALGRLAGLSAAYFVLLQFVYTGRILWVERFFGLDRLSRAHQRNGQLAILLILLHPILILVAGAQARSSSFLAYALGLFDQNDDLLSALTAALLFLIVGLLSLAMIRRRFKYELWYFIHLLMYLAIFFAYQHQFEFGSTINSNQFFYGYWLLLYLVILISFVIFRFLLPLYRFFQHRFTIARVEPESDSVTSVYIHLQKADRFKVEPGQFMIFRFFQKGFWYQAHPFSLSRPKSDGQIRISVKKLGDFTAKIPQLQPGTKVLIEGPYGLFTQRAAIKNKTLLVAGGIGITPIRSLYQSLLEQGQDVILLYGAQKASDLVLKEEIDTLSGRAFFILSKEQLPGYLHGRIDLEKVKKVAPDYQERDIYICGPVPMINSLSSSLLS
ncbi:MAG: hypothetical protein COU09_01505, partial [Candidatus Harrisonbacteria bacterium CG10_big_fil_rev_8_21_14_0_10_44_23]